MSQHACGRSEVLREYYDAMPAGARLVQCSVRDEQAAESHRIVASLEVEE